MTKIIGIDLGTTNSCASIVEQGHPKIIPFAKGYLTIPSVVAFTANDELLVGPDALRQAPTNPENTIYGSKRLLGRPYTSYVVQQVKRLFHYQIVEGRGGEVEVVGNGRPFTIPEVSALILRAIKKSAQEYLGEEDIKAVITVPAYFSDRQRHAVRDAGRMAGLDVVRIINEPTAAALAYGYRKASEKKVVIYDLGGGTFDVSVLELENEVYRVISTNGDTFLGGVDFDNRIVERLVTQFLQDTGVDLIGDRIALQRVKNAAEEAKKELSLRQEATISLPYLATGPNGPLDMNYTLKRAEFETMVGPLVDRTIDICQSALEMAKLGPQQIDEVVLVGGQTRMPMIWEKIRTYFGKSPSKGVHPDEVVAMGAAIMADIVSRGETGVLLIDVVPLSIGLELPGKRFKRIIPRNSQIPIKRTEVFTTAKDDQKSVKITVLQGESENAEDNEVLSKVVFSDLPPHKKGELKIEVTFSVNTDGILTVTAVDKQTGKQVKTTFSQRGGEAEQAPSP
ncbi:MAG TPA: molecular chaperone DnaK [bacterium]|nr:molecular chaperone DnaK [bacterium]